MARYALVVGISQYDYFPSPLSKPVGDAEAVAKLLRSHGDFQEVILLNKPKLIKAELFAQLQRLLIEQATGGEVLIYYTGHGTVVEDCGERKGYLAPSDCKANKDSATNGIPFGGLNTLIGQSKLSSLVVLLDCCHSGLLLKSIAETFTAFQQTDKNYAMIAACRDFEEAAAMRSEPHSIFTGALLQGLAREKANDQGQINASTLFGFIEDRLQQRGQEAVKLGYGQRIKIVDYRTVAGQKVAEEVCPYVGLKAFDQDTKNFFYGRQSQIDLLLEKIKNSRFVPVIGASGSGKSSLVKAGLMPALEKQGWCVLPPIKPWREPLTLLKKALVESFYTSSREINRAYDRLEAEGLNAILPDGIQRVLLVVDQFEELFTVCQKEQERQEFINLLVAGAEQEGRLTIATTMRADFVEQALHYPALAKLIQRDLVFWLVPLEPEEIKQAIVEPAKTQRYDLAPGLLEMICLGVVAEKNSLPLLEFALTELWQGRDQQNRRLTMMTYAEMGNLQGALDRHAQRLYEEGLRSPLERDWARRVFLKLVRTGQDIKDTRQRQPKQFLEEMGESDADREAIDHVLEVFAGQRGRLLVATEENNVAFIDLAHEALLEGWQEFAAWRKEDRDVRRLVDRINDEFKEWQKALESDKFLLSEGVVAQIEDVEANISSYLTTPDLKEYVQLSQYKYKPWLNPANLPEMVDILGGTFWMGSPEGKGDDDEKPRHKVTVPAFRMGKYPVTQAQWRTVAMSPKINLNLRPEPSRFPGDDCPVESVSWYEVREFCDRLSTITGQNYRLPTEAEWEYACRAGAQNYTEYCFGDDESQLKKYAWYEKDVTHPVGKHLPNDWGLYDMHGNVWEWCADEWHGDYENKPQRLKDNGNEPWIKAIKNDNHSQCVVRGGSWVNHAFFCRSAVRDRVVAGLRNGDIGFRVVVSGA